MDSIASGFRSRQSGFTILELMIAMGITTILATVSFPLYNRFIIEVKISDATKALYQTGKDIEAAKYRSPDFTYINAIQSNSGPSIDLAYKGVKTSFNIITGAPPTGGGITSQDGGSTGDEMGGDLYALSQLPGMEYLKPDSSIYSLNKFGFKVIEGSGQEGQQQGSQQIDRNKIMIGVELDPDHDGFYHVIALNESGRFFELCNDLSNQADEAGSLDYTAYSGNMPSCTLNGSTDNGSSNSSEQD